MCNERKRVKKLKTEDSNAPGSGGALGVSLEGIRTEGGDGKPDITPKYIFEEEGDDAKDSEVSKRRRSISSEVYGGDGRPACSRPHSRPVDAGRAIGCGRIRTSV